MHFNRRIFQLSVDEGQLDYLKFPLLNFKKFSIIQLTAVWGISLPNLMKLYRAVIDKHVPFREGRGGQKIIYSHF